MKRWSLLLVAALAGCSPTRPGPMDVQMAVERYFLDHAIRAQDNYSVVISCAPISEMAVDDSDGRLAHVRFRFRPAPGKAEGGGSTHAVAMRQGGRGWYIPREAKLEGLPCEAAKVGELRRS